MKKNHRDIADFAASALLLAAWLVPATVTAGVVSLPNHPRQNKGTSRPRS